MQVTFSDQPHYYKILMVNLDENGATLDCKLLRGQGSIGNYFPLHRIENDDENTLFAIIKSDRYDGHYDLVSKTNNMICRTRPIVDAEFYKTLDYSIQGEQFYCILYPIAPLSANVVQSIKDLTARVVSVMNNEFTNIARKNDYYKFNEHGELSEFLYTYNDGVVLEYKENATYTYNDGFKVIKNESFTSDDYEKLISSANSSPSPTEGKVIGVIFPDGTELHLGGRSNHSLFGKDIYGNELAQEMQDENGFYDQYGRNGDRSYSKLYFEDVTYERISSRNADASFNRILYPDGSFFEGEVSFVTTDNGKKPPLLCSEPVIEWTNFLFKDTGYIIDYKVLYDVIPKKGKCYNSNGVQFRAYESPTIWYDANSDGTVTEVYENGKAMAPGFARDKKINEYNGELKRQQEELKRKEELAKELAEQRRKREAEAEAWRKSMYAKYGKANIDKVSKMQIPLGVDIGIFDVVNSNVVLDYTRGNVKRYTVTIANILGGSKQFGVWTTNGKISSVIYYD